MIKRDPQKLSQIEKEGAEGDTSFIQALIEEIKYDIRGTPMGNTILFLGERLATYIKQLIERVQKWVNDRLAEGAEMDDLADELSNSELEPT